MQSQDASSCGLRRFSSPLAHPLYKSVDLRRAYFAEYDEVPCIEEEEEVSRRFVLRLRESRVIAGLGRRRPRPRLHFASSRRVNCPIDLRRRRRRKRAGVITRAIVALAPGRNYNTRAELCARELCGADDARDSRAGVSIALLRRRKSIIPRAYESISANAAREGRPAFGNYLSVEAIGYAIAGP